MVDYYYFSYGLLLLLLCVLVVVAPFLLASMSKLDIVVPGVTETFFVRRYIVAIAVPT